MATKENAQIIERALIADDIIKDARPFDIILFNNNLYKGGKFSPTSFSVKLGSNSVWNHAALIMDENPFSEKTNSTRAESEKCKCKREHQGKCTYVYEYEGHGKPITYKTLEEKLNSEAYNSITLIRFRKFYMDVIKKPSHMIFAKAYVKHDFRFRMGRSASEVSCVDKKRNLSYKYSYNTTNIFHRTLLTTSLFAPLGVIIGCILAIHSPGSSAFLFWSLVYLFIHLILIVTLEYIYILRYKKVISRRAICSGYPPEIISSIMFDVYKESEEKETFNRKWILGTPPSPKNLYMHGASSKDCIVYNYVKPK